MTDEFKKAAESVLGDNLVYDIVSTLQSVKNALSQNDLPIKTKNEIMDAVRSVLIGWWSSVREKDDTDTDTVERNGYDPNCFSDDGFYEICLEGIGSEIGCKYYRAVGRCAYKSNRCENKRT